MEDLDISELSALLAEQTQRLGADHIDVLSTRHLLAKRFAERSGYAQAMPLFEQLVVDRTRVIGAKHRDTLASHHNFALCLARCGHLEKSKVIFQEVIRLLEEAYGSEDDDTIRTRQWYLSDVVTELESEEVVLKEYEALLATVSRVSKKRKSRSREIREQYEEYRAKIGERSIDLDLLEILEEKLYEMLGEEKGDDTPSKEDVRESKPLKFTAKLGAWHSKLAANELGGEIEYWQRAILFDAQKISLEVVGTIEDELVDFLKEKFPCDQGEQGTLSQFQVLEKLVEKGTDSARRLAGQISLAYVDFAYFCVHTAGTDYGASAEKIDHLRHQLREFLGPDIDTTSDAEIEFESSFQEIVGLESVKNALLGFIRMLTEDKRQLARGGSKGDPPRLHLVFTGSPGTGKTTVARLYGRLLFRLGLLDSDKFTEIDKSRIVSTYTGGTEKETQKVLTEANPGVLFIDEAYSFNDDYGDSKGPGRRALEIILRYMEDNRGTLAIIFAGYAEQMTELVKLNPGIPSRIGATIDFPNYSLEELMEIARRKASKRGLKFDNRAEQKLEGVVKPLMSEEFFGNAREIENLVEDSRRNLINRLAPLDDLATSNERRLILEKDIPLRDKPTPRRYGFN